MSLEKALSDVKEACQNLGFAIGVAWRRCVADIGRCVRRRDPVIGFDRRPTKQQRDSVFFAPLDLLIQPQGDKFAQDYASRVNVEAWSLCRRFGREPNNARPSVTRHIHKLTRYSQRALTGRG